MLAAERESQIPDLEAGVIGGKILEVITPQATRLFAFAKEEEVDEITYLMQERANSSQRFRSHKLTDEISALTVGDGFQHYALDEAFRTGSKGSEAVYPIVGIFENHMILGQYLKAHGRTSWHTQPEVEIFSNATGGAFLYLKEDKVMPVADFKQVNPHEPHMIYTPFADAFTMLYQEGNSFSHSQMQAERPSIQRLIEITQEAGYKSNSFHRL